MNDTPQADSSATTNINNETTVTNGPAPRARKKRPGDDRYNPETAVLVCERIATSPVCMEKICEAPDMPSVACVFRWLRDHADFREMYVIAKEMQVEYLLEQCLDIVDDDSRDIITTADGRKIINTAVLRRHKMQIDFRKWLASKLLPRKYGNHRAAAAATPKPKPKPGPPPCEVTEGGVKVITEADAEAHRAAYKAWIADTLAGAEWEKRQEEIRLRHYPDGKWHSKPLY